MTRSFGLDAPSALEAFKNAVEKFKDDELQCGSGARLPQPLALVHELELARNEPDSQVHHLPRAYDDGLPSSAIRLRM